MLNLIFTMMPWPRLFSAAIAARACSSSIWAALREKGGKNRFLKSKNCISTKANPFCLNQGSGPTWFRSYLSVPFLPLACRISFSFFTTTGTLISVPLANILGFSWWQQTVAFCGFKVCFCCSEEMHFILKNIQARITI